MAASLFRAELKLNNISVISVMGKEVITAIYSSKASAFDWTLGEISELSYILADLLV